MFRSRFVRGASRAGPSPSMSLREATRTARRMGCLGATASPSSSASADALLLRRCTGPDVRRAASRPSLETAWGNVVHQQLQLFHAAHTPSDDTAIASTVSAVNMIHIEGVVKVVRCGHDASHSPGPSGSGEKNRRTVTVTTPSTASYPSVLLWLQVRDGAAVADTSCLLAVRCRLLPELVEARWRAREVDASSPTTNSSSATQPVDEAEGGVSAAKLRCVKAWVAAALLQRRVVVSGQLRVTDVYDGDMSAVVAVPVIELPMNSLMGCVKVIDNFVSCARLR